MLTAMLAAFAGGLILNFMPCVFPVISLKALSLLGQQGNAAETRKEGLGFLLGVVVTMLALAGLLLALRAGGTAVGWGFQLQSPLVVAGLALVILLAAVNLLGVFEIGLTAQRAGSLQGGKGTFTRSALTGALSIIVATPCSAPFMAGAVGYALVQPTWVALLIFLMLALGFAAPFVLISLFPALAQRLPRPGAWMATLRRGLAFPMFAAWGWLVWVLAQQAGTTALAALLAASVVISFAAWIYGIAQHRQFAGRSYKALLTLAAALLLVTVVPLPGVMKVTAAPALTAGAQTAGAAEVTPVAWTPQALSEKEGKGRPILVNFTASWCITCQVNERTSLSTDAVKQALTRTDTLYMVGDSTKFNPDIDDMLTQFGQGGLPFYLVYPANGGKPEVLPQVLTPAIVVNALERAAKKT